MILDIDYFMKSILKLIFDFIISMAMILLTSQTRCVRPFTSQSVFNRPPVLRTRHTRCLAQNDASNDAGSKKKKFITKEEEPDQYWTSEGERKGANPMKDPLAIIGLIAIFAPFVILAIAAATGLVDLTP